MRSRNGIKLNQKNVYRIGGLPARFPTSRLLLRLKDVPGLTSLVRFIADFFDGETPNLDARYPATGT